MQVSKTELTRKVSLNSKHNLNTLRTIPVWVHYESEPKWIKRNNIWYNEAETKDIELHLNMLPGEFVYSETIRRRITETEEHLDLVLEGYILNHFKLNEFGRHYY